MRTAFILAVAVLGACASEHGGGTDIPPVIDVGDIGGVAGEAVHVPTTVKVSTGFTVLITTAGCHVQHYETTVDGLDITPYDMRPELDNEESDCVGGFAIAHHDTPLWISTPGVHTVRIHVLRHGEPTEITADVDVQP